MDGIDDGLTNDSWIKTLVDEAREQFKEKFFAELKRADADPSHLAELARDVTDEQVKEYREREDAKERAIFEVSPF